MPCISKFFGIAIYMYYSDHAPPHFHAIYGEHEAAVDIHTAEGLTRKFAAPGAFSGNGVGYDISGGVARELGTGSG